MERCRSGMAELSLLPESNSEQDRLDGRVFVITLQKQLPIACFMSN